MADKDYKESDFWAQKAKKEGYPARSVYKLEELQKAYKIIPNGGRIMDVGAAPGSWTLYVARNILKGKGQVVSVDLKDLSLSPMPQNVVALKGDAFSEENLNKLKSFGEYDAIISDAAPSTSGNKGIDASRSAELVNNVITLASECLKKDASLVVKIFQGEDFKATVDSMRGMFKKVIIHKPKACRASSVEVYIVGLNLI